MWGGDDGDDGDEDDEDDDRLLDTRTDSEKRQRQMCSSVSLQASVLFAQQQPETSVTKTHTTRPRALSTQKHTSSDPSGRRGKRRAPSETSLESHSPAAPPLTAVQPTTRL